MDVDSAYNHFMQIIRNIIDQHAPFRQITINPKKYYTNTMDDTCSFTVIKTFDKLYRKQLKHPRHHDSHLKYIKYRTLFNKLKRTSKELYYAHLFEKYKGYIRKTWKTLNSITGHCNDKSIINSKFHINTKITENTSEIANGFCKYFSDVGETKRPKSKHSFNAYIRTERNHKSLLLSPTDPNEIQQIISFLKPKKSTGHDNISSIFIKHVQAHIKLPLSIVINKSLENGYIPTTFKIAKVTPIFKAKDSQEFTNYRPISLLPTISKILEKKSYINDFTTF